MDMSGHGAHAQVFGVAGLASDMDLYPTRAMKFEGGYLEYPVCTADEYTVAVWAYFDEVSTTTYKECEGYSHTECDIDVIPNAWKHLVGVFSHGGRKLVSLKVNDVAIDTYSEY